MPEKAIENTKNILNRKYEEIRALMEEYLTQYLGTNEGFPLDKAKVIAADAANITLLDMMQVNLPHAEENYEEQEGELS